MVSLSVGSKDETALSAALQTLESLCRREKAVTVLGPVDAFVPVVQNVRWSRIYLKVADLAVVRGILAPLVNRPKESFPGVEIKIEVE